MELYQLIIYGSLISIMQVSLTEGLGLLHMRESGVKGLTIFLGFILSPAGIFKPYIEFRETHKVH